MGETLRTSTWIEKDADGGWYCVVGFWIREGRDEKLLEQIGDGSRDCDESIRVGPFSSRQVARRELRGDFRKLVLGAIQELNQRRGGEIVAQAWGDVPESEPGN